MLKKFTLFARGLCLGMALAATAFAPWQSARADRLLDENFEYPAGNLYQQGSWVRYGGNTAAPIQVAEGNLTYEGYIDEALGNKVSMVNTGSGEDLWKAFNGDVKVAEGTVYAAFLLDVAAPNVKATEPIYFFHFFAQSKNGMGDGTSTTDVGKLWMMAGADESHYKLGLTRGGGKDKIVSVDNEFETGITYLVVVSYEIVEGATNDIVSLWVNPVTGGSTAPAYLVQNNSGETGSDASMNYGGLMGVTLRQGATSKNPAPDLCIDALRVAQNWADLFPEKAVVTPEILLSVPSARMAPAYGGTPLTATVFVGGKNLTGDITISCPEGVACSKSVISAEEAMAEDPVELVFSLTAPETAGEYTYTVTLDSEDATQTSFEIVGEVVETVDVPNAVKFMQEFENGSYDGITYRYTGKAVVTAIDRSVDTYGSVQYSIYAQDMTGGIMLNTSWMGIEEISLKAGDEITGIPFMIEGYLGAPQMMALPMDMDMNFYILTAEGKSKTPAEIKIADVTSTTAMEYIYRLLKVNGVRFVKPEGQFAAGSFYDITDGEKTAKIKIANGSDLIGTDIPSGTFSITGVDINPTGLTLLVTSASSLEAGVPSVAITPEKLFDFTANAAPIGERTAIAKYTAAAENLPSAVPVKFNGENADLFVAEPAELPAGSATTEVTVYFVPEYPGIYKGGVFFDFDAINPELNYTATYSSCKAYDPQNMPSVTIEPATIELECKAGETITGTAVLNASGAFDYITATRGGEGSNGGITIDNTYLLPNAKDVTLTVTFAPKEAGEYTETWTYTTTLCETPAVLTVKAVCLEDLPEEPTEGDTELKADFTNPLTYYAQDFTGQESNKPLNLTDWTNVALEGTRAWWGYAGEADGEQFTAAKVTAYDSNYKPGDSSDCTMELVSPALDFKNATSKKLKFRLMGMYLNENSGDELTVNIGFMKEGPDGPEMNFYELSGFDIPAIADEAGKWFEYDVDMSVVPDMPDSFVIAFEFNGKRGVDNTTTYYITDFVWGEKSGSLNGIAAEGLQPDADGVYRVYNLQGICVLATREAAEIYNLPAGMYICAGRKFILK